MKSKISLYDPGVGKNLLKRCWPLWTGYFAILLLALPMSLSALQDSQSDFYYYEVQVARDILSGGRIVGIYVSFAVSALTAMCMYSYLYNTRSCGMMCSLPVRRETMFLTAYLTGLLPLLAADVLTVMLTALFYMGNAAVTWDLLLQWLALAVMGNIAFYGMAVFCAMLTGSIIILPAVYVVLNLAAIVVEACALSLMEQFVYGYNPGSFFLIWLSPVAKLATGLIYINGYNGYEIPEFPHILDWYVLIVYCAVGLLLSLAALLLYRKRNMETATDTVAIPCLKPLFRYCMGVGTALVFATAVYSLFLSDRFRFRGPVVAVVIGLLLVAGTVIGYFTAEMLIQKTVRVFGSKWRGCIIICCVLAALTACLELDAFRIERSMPNAEDVMSVSISGQGNFAQLENIEKVIELNRQVVAEKKRAESAGEFSYVSFHYYLKGDKYLTRSYVLENGSGDPESIVMQIQRMINLPEAVQYRSRMDYENLPLTSETLASARLYCYDDGTNYTIPQDKAMEFIETCLRPDINDCTMGRGWFVHTEDYFDLETSWRIQIEWRDNAPGSQGYGHWKEFTVQMDAVRSVRWLEEELGVDIQPLRVTRPEEVEVYETAMALGPG